MHYARWRKTGDPGDAAELRPARSEGTCAVEGCDEPVRTREWCNAHYQRWAKYGDPTTTRKRVGRSTCTVEGCDKPLHGSGYCSTHWAAAKRRGEFGGESCAVDGCDRLAQTRGWCTGHYKRWLNYGDPEGGVKAMRGTVSTGLCAVEGCERDAFAASSGEPLCQRHHMRWYQHGDARADVEVRTHYDTDECTLPGCNRPRAGGAYCNPHELRNLRYGDPYSGGRFMDEIPEACTVEGCDGDYYALDRCERHYKELPHQREWAAEYNSRPEVRARNREKAMRRHAVKKAAAPVWPISVETIEGRIAVLNSRCWICGTALDDLDEPFHLDHVKPIAARGGHAASNLRPACRVCNQSKGGRWPVDTSTAAVRLDPARLP
jgi:5-methylcytosine-specific restriction endonuclease McrA